MRPATPPQERGYVNDAGPFFRLIQKEYYTVIDAVWRYEERSAEITIIGKKLRTLIRLIQEILL